MAAAKQDTETEQMKKTLKLQSISYSKCFEDGPVSIELVQHYLSRYSCKSVLETVSALSFLRGCVSVASGRRDLSPKRIWRALTRATFGPGAIRRSIGDDADIIFSRRSLLLVAREALRACRDEGRDPRDEEHLGEIGRVLIAAADLLRPMSESDDDQLAAMAASNMFVGTGIKNRVVSSVRILDALLRQFPPADDPKQTFQRAVGIGISEYQTLCLSTFLPILIRALGTGRDVANVIDVRKYMSCISISGILHAGYAKKQIEYFLDSTSHDIDSARREAETPSYRSELTLFRTWPLLKTGGDNYLVIDSGFLLDKLYTGPFFALIDHGKGGHSQVLNRQGPAFEDYANWLISNSIDSARESVISNPHFLIKKENEEICDIALWSGEAAVLIECKGCFLRLQALARIIHEEWSRVDCSHE
jgi:hypothetical protein